MEASITNTTQEKRTFIVTGVAYDAAKKPVANAAVMINNLEPGKTGKGSGVSNKAAKGKLTCQALNISSLKVG